MPRINIVFLDDGVKDLPADANIRRNDWVKWENRLPTFLDKLKLVAEFGRASGEKPIPEASLYALEISSSLPRDRVEGIIAAELQLIYDVTKRPSAVLARSSSGTDQLRIVFQDSRDYPPAHAAKFLQVLAEISPAIADRRIAENFGPFNAPPTIVFDPRLTELCTDISNRQLPKQRWGILEETYLLPHYILHCLACLSRSVSDSTETFYDASIPEPGVVTIVLAPSEVMQAACATVAESMGAGSSRIRVEATDFLRNRTAANGSILACPVPNLVTLNVAPQNTQFFKVVSYLEQQGTPYKVISWNDVGRRTATQILTKIPVKHNTGYVCAEPFTGGQANSAINLDVDGIKALKPHVVVTRTELNGAYIDRLVSLGLRVDECRIDKVPIGVGGAIGPFGASLNVMATPSLLQDRDKIRTVDSHSSNGRWSGSFSPSKLLAISDRPPTALPANGGVIFDKGNIYSLDLTGNVRLLGDKALAALDASGGMAGTFEEKGKTQQAVGVPMGYGRKGAPSKTTVDLLLFHTDLSGKDAGCLPFALPRFWKPDTKTATVFGGGWTFEPLVMEGMDNLQAKTVSPSTCKVIVNPLETGNHLSYLCKEDSESDPDNKAAGVGYGSGDISLTPEGGDFLPDFLSNKDGTFSWVLRHGVTILFDKNGLILGIRGPGNDRVDYIRTEGKISEKKTSDNRSCKIEYVRGEPAGAAFPDSITVEYGYKSKRLQEVKNKGQVCRLEYDHDGRLAKIEGSDGAINLKHDSQGRLMEVASTLGEISLNYLDSGNTLRITDNEHHAVDWRFGPKRRVVGVTMNDRAVLWTRSSDGRIIQMALGGITTFKEGYEFRPEALIGTLP